MMKPLLQKDVEGQLLNDLFPYGLEPAGLSIDWSEACPEGHCMKVLDGNLEEVNRLMPV